MDFRKNIRTESMGFVLMDWVWYGTGIHGTLATNGKTEVTTGEIIASTQINDNAFLIRTTFGKHYKLICAKDENHLEKMARFSAREVIESSNYECRGNKTPSR